jgi:ABC-type iron transport system FetAB ATPase subunit
VSLFELHDLAIGALAPWELRVEAGECVGLTGPSGSGKSRLLRAMADLDIHQGEAGLEGRGCREYDPCSWRSQVGLLPAESAWWGETIGEHFQRAPEEARLKALGFSIQTLDWSVARCSTGERQRLALLRLLENRPRVLLLDEPTASLDPANVQAAESMITDYLRMTGAAAIWVGHDPEQLRRMARRQFAIRHGEVVEVTP